MPIMGLSGTDLKHAGWNLTVAAGVVVACAFLAKRVSLYAYGYTSKYLKARPGTPESQRAWNIAGWTGVAVGIGAASLMNWKISSSRFGLINNPSLDKMFKLGTGQAALGLALDSWIESFPFFTGCGSAIAAAGHWNRYSLIGIGAIGAVLGGGKI